MVFKMHNNQKIHLLLLLILSFSISSCKLMPYKNDFDCPIPKGQKCKSLYEVNKMADQGVFDPNNSDKFMNKSRNKLNRCSNIYGEIGNESKHP